MFYELGIAQAFSKTVILLAHRDSPIPFDISNNRIILYKDYEDLKEKLYAALSNLEQL